MIYYLLILAFFASNIIFCSENSYRVGTIDQLVLQKYILYNGLNTLKNEIEKHLFCVSEQLDVSPLKEINNPFVISRVCSRDFPSDLSKEVFAMVRICYQYKIPVKLDGNSLNATYQKDRIDYCTSISSGDEQWIGRANTVQLKTHFYDKQSLINALEMIEIRNK